MQETEPQSSQDPHEEIELLRERLRRLEAEHAEVQQRLFDQYEWTREKTKAFDKELRSLRSISFEYKLLDFFRQIYQRTTGLPEKTLEEDVERLKVFLTAIPTKNDPNTDAWLRSMLRQTHSNFEVVVVIGNSDPEPAQDIKDTANVRIVRTKDEYSDAIRANVGLCYASGDIWGLIVGGYWPYPRSVENICQFFAEHRTCEVMLPGDLTLFGDGLIAPTDYPRHQDFIELWKSYSSKGGCLLFRPKTYKKIGRINYEAGEAWLFGTLLQLAWYSDVGRSDAFVVVNAEPALRTETLPQIESGNQWVRKHFYAWGFFNEYGKPVWYFPFRHTGHLLRGLRIRLERFFQYIRNAAFQLRYGIFSHDFFLRFPAAGGVGSAIPRSADLDFSQVDHCPLTETLPDRFLFSLGPLKGERLADVYYASRTSVAVVSRRRFSPEGSSGLALEAVNGHARASESDWRFVRPCLFAGAGGSQPHTPEPNLEESGKPEQLQTAYENVVAQLMNGERAADSLWIGDSRFAPNEASAINYRERKIWEEYPALASGHLETLMESNLLAGRNTENGFDLIHLAGILQLCRRPRHLLRFLAFALKYDAPILVSTPNLDSSELHGLGPAWCHWDPQRTCFVYGTQSLRALMRHCGFEEKILVSFSHSLWRTASRRNLANAVPSADSRFLEGLPAPSKRKNQPPSADLEGDFLVGLFNRKL
jgi:glycosyltransferase involved in cell wall biosynthesis